MNTGIPDSGSHTLPEANLEDLSKAELVELARLYARLFFAMDGFWYLAVKELVDEDMATAVDLWVWDKYARYEVRRLLPLLKLQNDDLTSFAKAFGLFLSTSESGPGKVSFTMRPFSGASSAWVPILFETLDGRYAITVDKDMITREGGPVPPVAKSVFRIDLQKSGGRFAIDDVKVWEAVPVSGEEKARKDKRLKKRMDEYVRQHTRKKGR